LGRISLGHGSISLAEKISVSIRVSNSVLITDLEVLAHQHQTGFFFHSSRWSPLEQRTAYNLVAHFRKFRFFLNIYLSILGGGETIITYVSIPIEDEVYKGVLR
jgi:hypothetical protein